MCIRDSLAPEETALASFHARLRIERRILFAAQCLAGELDEMVSNEADAEYGLDLAPPQSIMDGAPERPAIIRQDPKIEHDPECHHRRARKIGPSELAGSGRNQTVRKSGVDLMLEAREQPLGIVRIGDRAAPHRHNLDIGPQKVHVAFAVFIADETSIPLEPVP